MRVNLDINVEVSAYYLDIEGLRFVAQYGSDRVGEFFRLLAKADVEDGKVGSVWVTAAGHYVKKDGTVGQNVARIRFGNLEMLPEDWQQRIIADLQALADKVTVSG
jgi:hypothetical protein